MATTRRCGSARSPPCNRSAAALGDAASGRAGASAHRLLYRPAGAPSSAAMKAGATRSAGDFEPALILEAAGLDAEAAQRRPPRAGTGAGFHRQRGRRRHSGGGRDLGAGGGGAAGAAGRVRDRHRRVARVSTRPAALTTGQDPDACGLARWPSCWPELCGCARWASPCSSRRIELACELIERASCAPPPRDRAGDHISPNRRGRPKDSGYSRPATA